MTVREIREVTGCPRCGAQEGERCVKAGRRVDTICPPRRGLAEAHHGWQGQRPDPHDRAERNRWRQSAAARRR